MLISVVVAVMVSNRDAQDAEQAKQRQHLWARLHELQKELEELRNEALDDRILLHEQVEPEELREWQELIEGERQERALDEVEPEEREEMLGLIAETDLLRQRILASRLQALHDFATATAQATDQVQLVSRHADETEPEGPTASM